jgi:hypothetical protein
MCKKLGGPGNVLYVHPSQRHLIGDKRVPILFVEGIKKALAIVSAARRQEEIEQERDELRQELEALKESREEAPESPEPRSDRPELPDAGGVPETATERPEEEHRGWFRRFFGF